MVPSSRSVSGDVALATMLLLSSLLFVCEGIKATISDEELHGKEKYLQPKKALVLENIDDIPGIVNGWATISDVDLVDPDGIEAKKTADKYNVTVKPDNTYWLKNAYTPFIGKKFIIERVEIEERNTYNTLIQTLVTTANVRWEISSETQGNENPTVVTSFRETISQLWTTKKTGNAKIVGWGSDKLAIVTDSKAGFGQDWGILEVVDSSDTELVIRVDQEKKGKFKMFWKLEE